MKKEYRVKKSKEIEAIMNRKRYSSNPYFIIYVKEQSETSHFRYAISVSKKIGKAVDRNKIKRQVRAIMDSMSIHEGIDLFIIVRIKIKEIDFCQMQKELSFLLQKQKLLVKGE